uniref:Secreted protein n=1 Tax=Castor canadensis TaxID=51338 RepID=A0A8C0XB57_CASCN
MSRLLALSLLTWDSAMSARSSASSSSCCTLRNLDRLLILQLPHPGLQLLKLFLATLQGDLLCLVQPVLQILNGLLHVLLHALQVIIGTDCVIQLELGVLGESGFVAATSLRIQGGLQRVHHPQVVALGLLHLLILLCQLPLDLCLDLVELQLGSEDLTLLVFQGRLREVGKGLTWTVRAQEGEEGGRGIARCQPGLWPGEELGRDGEMVL